MSTHPPSRRPEARRLGSFVITLLHLPLALLAAGCSLTRVPADAGARRSLALHAVAVPADAWPARFLPPRMEGAIRFDPAEGTARDPLEFRLIAEPVRSSLVVWGGWPQQSLAAFGRTLEFRTCTFRTPPKHTTAADPLDADPVWGEMVLASPDLAALGRLQAQAPLAVDWRLTLPGPGPVRGVCVRLRSIGPSRFEAPLDEEMLRRGWAVLSVRGWTLRFPDAADPSPDGDERTLDLAVEQMESLHADWALAVESATAFVESRAAGLAGLPRVLVGCSFGALVACPVAAKMDPPPSAMVLVGGGADGLRAMAYASRAVSSSGMLPLGGGRASLTPEQAEGLHEAYLARAKLDPYHTAPALAGVPTLMLQGDCDGIVLPRFGDLLWERLGRPERWHGNYGHTLLFYWLPDSAADIADWIGAHAGEASPGGR